MKRLLLLLLISTIAYGIVEESKEYDDVSLEINLKPFRDIINKEKDTAINAATKATKPVQQAVTKVTKPVQQEVTKITKPVQQEVTKITKPLSSNVIKKVVKPSINTVKKIEVPIKKMIDPAIKHIQKFLNDNPKIKKISDPLIKEIHKVIKDPKKTIQQILKDPKNAQKVVGKALKTIMDKVKASHPFEKIKAELKDLENFMKKKISVQELKKLFVDKPVQFFNQLSQKARNGIYWLKKKGYWEPIKFAVKTAEQYGATALCSAYLSPFICKPAVDLAFSLVVNKYIDKF
jgi:F0F1-type ATP synthase membrane subunit b/b'